MSALDASARSGGCGVGGPTPNDPLRGTPPPALDVRLRGQVGALTIDVSLSCERGVLGLCGPNGSGKTTLLSMVLGAHAVREGFIRIGGAAVFDSSAGVDVPLEARRLGYVPQDYALFPHLSAVKNVAFAVASADPRASRRDISERANSALAELGAQGLADRLPTQLSGGERQRVALARVLAMKPRGLLLDEPLAALDPSARRDVRTFLRETLERVGLPTILVTHDADDARSLCDTIAVIEKGRMAQAGSWADLAADPRTPFIRELVRVE